ncbi:MAG: asparagine synthase, partial [Gemmatimonadetes bacterium]|nr:asparagine synthase [Gemmatimonadota bacterium]
DWTFPFSGDGYLSGSESMLARELRELLMDSTRIRLRSDVPVGAYLSGGLDSSVLVSLIHEANEAELRSFSIGFEAAALDETPFQRSMIDHVGADHSGITCTSADVARNFVDTVEHTEVPVLRTAPTPMKLLSGFVRDHGYKVVLTGEGADEALGGYDLFKEAKVRRFWSRQPDSSWRPLLLQRLYPYLDLTSMRAQGYVRRFFGIGLDDPDSSLFAHLPRWETASMGKAFFSRRLVDEITESALDTMSESIPERASDWHPFNRGQYVEAKSLLPGYLLSSQGDRMLMANGVEGRFPFLDHRVIEFANRLDPRLKMKVLREKYLLKRAMEGQLPPEILGRPKHPYRAPDIEAFFRDGVAAVPYVDELLSAETVARYGYFDPKKVGLLKEKARAGSAKGVKDNQAFVGILSTQIWHYLFIDRFQTEFAGDLQDR